MIQCVRGGPDSPTCQFAYPGGCTYLFASAAALFAAHRAFIAAASCARRSGVRLSFLFTFLAALGLLTAASRVWVGVKRRFFFSVRPEVLALSRVLLARAADFLFFLAMPAFVTASSFCFSLASFFAPFCRRASSRRIFLLRFLGFIGISCASARAANGALDFELMTKPHQCHAIVCPALKPRLRRLFARGVYAVGVPSLLAKCQCLTVMTLLPGNPAAVIQGVRLPIATARHAIRVINPRRSTGRS